MIFIVKDSLKGPEFQFRFPRFLGGQGLFVLVALGAHAVANYGKRCCLCEQHVQLRATFCQLQASEKKKTLHLFLILHVLWPLSNLMFMQCMAFDPSDVHCCPGDEVLQRHGSKAEGPKTALYISAL